MARLFLCCLIVSDLLFCLAMARPLSVAIRAANVELHGHIVADPPSSILTSNGMTLGLAGAPEKANYHNHRPFDKSMTGGEVIIGGLATAILAAVFCYIRITRKRVEVEKS